MVCASLRQIKQKQTIPVKGEGRVTQSRSCMIKCTKTSLTSRIIPFFLR